MDTQWLREHVSHLKEHLDHFERMAQQLERYYQRSLQQISDIDVKSTLVENYIIQLDRQKKAIQAMNDLHRQASDQLIALES